jgi:hypothetical protein
MEARVCEEGQGSRGRTEEGPARYAVIVGASRASHWPSFLVEVEGMMHWNHGPRGRRRVSWRALIAWLAGHTAQGRRHRPISMDMARWGRTRWVEGFSVPEMRQGRGAGQSARKMPTGGIPRHRRSRDAMRCGEKDPGVRARNMEVHGQKAGA